MRSICVMTVAILFVSYHAAFGEDGAPCTNPLGHIGTCRMLSTCKSLHKLYLDNDKEALDIIRRSICDFAGSYKGSPHPIVCCPPFYNHTHKYNGGNDDNDNKDHTKKKTNSRYGPLLEPVCGRPEPSPNASYPHIHFQSWATVLGYDGETIPNTIDWSCGGSLISSRHVLTAAHCVYRRPTLFLVRVGDYDLNSDYDSVYPVDALIEKRTVHPQFNPRAFVNDIAVLRLQDDIQLRAYIQPICLPVPAALRKTNLLGKRTFGYGWGHYKYNGSPTSRLILSYIPIVPEESCKIAYGKFKKTSTIDERVVCAGGYGSGTCKGDSGGPLVVSTGIAYYVVGVISYAYKCAELGYPTVFTRVTSFLDFIESQLN